MELFFFPLQELTGKLPSDYPLMPDENPPQVRRRIGASFKLDEGLIYLEREVWNIHAYIPSSSCPWALATKLLHKQLSLGLGTTWRATGLIFSADQKQN